jgi:hypothetical protein
LFKTEKDIHKNTLVALYDNFILISIEVFNLSIKGWSLQEIQNGFWFRSHLRFDDGKKKWRRKIEKTSILAIKILETRPRILIIVPKPELTYRMERRAIEAGKSKRVSWIIQANKENRKRELCFSIPCHQVLRQEKVCCQSFF